MIIFGWGHQTIKNFGITFKNYCSSCNNEDYWQLLRITTWFTLFFIPIIPYKQKYFLMCPVCEKGIYLKGDKFDELRDLAEANTDLANNRITIQEYNERIANSKKGENENNKYIEGEVELEAQDQKSDKSRVIFCANCGLKNNFENNFCQECGEKIN